MDVERIYLRVDDEWVELPRTNEGHRAVYTIPPDIATEVANGETLTLKSLIGYDYETYTIRGFIVPPAATITDATLELTRSPFSGGLAYRWADEEE